MGHGLKALALAVLLISPMTAAPAGIEVGGKEWRQLTETTGFSWFDVVNNVCHYWDGECSGRLNDVDFTGWTWASHADVQALFNILIPRDPQALDSPYGYYLDFDIADFEAALSGAMFQPTFSESDQTGFAAYLTGYSRDWYSDPYWGESARIGQLTYFDADANRPDLYEIGQAILNRSRDMDLSADPQIGFWLYRLREPTRVPEPGTIALLGLGFAGLALNRRRRAD